MPKQDFKIVPVVKPSTQSGKLWKRIPSIGWDNYPGYRYAIASYRFSAGNFFTNINIYAYYENNYFDIAFNYFNTTNDNLAHSKSDEWQHIAGTNALALFQKLLEGSNIKCPSSFFPCDMPGFKVNKCSREQLLSIFKKISQEIDVGIIADIESLMATAPHAGTQHVKPATKIPETPAPTTPAAGLLASSQGSPIAAGQQSNTATSVKKTDTPSPPANSGTTSKKQFRL